MERGEDVLVAVRGEQAVDVGGVGGDGGGGRWGGERVEHVLKRRFGSAKHLNNDRNLRVIDDAIGIGDDFTGIKRIIT